MAVPQDEHARFAKEMVESHNVVTTALREEFRKQMEEKLSEQRKNMKVKRSILTTEHGNIDIPIIKL